MSAIFKKEFKGYFIGPIGYVTLFFLFFITAIFFTDMFQSGYPYISYLFSNSALLSALIIPVITMRLFSEERKNKTDQALFSAPCRLSAIVMGKFFAAMALFALGFAPTLIYQIIISSMVSSNWLLYILCFVGMMLFAAAFVSINCLISSLTESQAVAAIIGFAITVGILIISTLTSLITGAWFKGIADVLVKYSFFAKLDDFNNGVLSIGSIVYFVTITAVFLFFTTLSLNKRRWK